MAVFLCLRLRSYLLTKIKRHNYKNKKEKKSLKVIWKIQKNVYYLLITVTIKICINYLTYRFIMSYFASCSWSEVRRERARHRCGSREHQLSPAVAIKKSRLSPDPADRRSPQTTPGPRGPGPGRVPRTWTKRSHAGTQWPAHDAGTNLLYPGGHRGYPAMYIGLRQTKESGLPISGSDQRGPHHNRQQWPGHTSHDHSRQTWGATGELSL